MRPRVKMQLWLLYNRNCVAQTSMIIANNLRYYWHHLGKPSASLSNLDIQVSGRIVH